MRPSALLLALACLAPALRAQERYPEGIVAIVDGEPITRWELDLLCRLAEPAYRQLATDDARRTELLEKQLDSMIQERILLLRAQSEQVELGPEDDARLERELDREAERYGGRDGLREALRKEGVPLGFLQRRLRNNLMVTKLLLKHISRDVFVGPEEVRRYYDEHGDEFATKKLLRVRQIVVLPGTGVALRERTPPLLEEALRQGAFNAPAYAAALRTRILAGEAFEAVARAGSMGPDEGLVLEFKGNDRPQDALIAPLGDLAESLPVGQVSGVVTSETGTLHLLLVEERAPAGKKPLAVVQGDIERKLKDELWDSRVADWIEQAKRQAIVLKYFPPKR